MTDGLLLGTLIREAFNYLLKAGTGAMPVVATFIVVYFVREGLNLVRGYVSSRDKSSQDLLVFIQATQQRQDARENRFAQTFENLSQTLSRISGEVEGQGRKQDAMALKLEKINDDLWKARG